MNHEMLLRYVIMIIIFAVQLRNCQGGLKKIFKIGGKVSELSVPVSLTDKVNGPLIKYASRNYKFLDRSDGHSYFFS